MSISNFIHQVNVKFDDKSFYNDFKKIDNEINNSGTVCSFEKCICIFKSIKDLNEDVNCKKVDLLKRTSLVNVLISKFYNKIESIEDVALKRVLIKKVDEIACRGLSSLPSDVIAYLGNFLTSKEAAKLLSLSHKIHDGLLKNLQLSQDIFIKRTEYIIKKMTPFKSATVYISTKSRKLSLLGDSETIKMVIKTNPSLVYQFDSVIFNQNKKIRELSSVIDRLNKNKEELNNKLPNLRNKINSINLTIDFIRNGFVQQKRMFGYSKAPKKDISKLSDLIGRQLKQNKKFIECAKKVEALEDDISLIDSKLSELNKTDMLEELSFLVENIKKHSRLKYLTSYKNTYEFETAYARIREIDLAVKINNHEEEVDPNSPEKTLDRAAVAFARNDRAKGMEEFNRLAPDLQCLVYYYLYESRCQDRFPHNPPQETYRAEFGKEAFLELNGIKASNTERLRAVEMAREHIELEKELPSLPTSSPQEENLVNTLKAILIRDVQTAETHFKKLDPDAQNSVYHRIWANTFVKRYLITPELKDLLSRDSTYGQKAFHNLYPYPFGNMEKARALYQT